MAQIPILGLRTHAQKVCSLYKRACRNADSWCTNRLEYRYDVTVLRSRFDANKDIKDMREADRLLQEGEHELWLHMHPQPKKFAQSPGGCDFEREVIPPDWVLDYWHPLEKAMYPEYFARREQRKKEYIELWTKKYGKPTPKQMHDYAHEH